MSEIFDVYTIIFLILAVFIIFRLRSVLGKRTGNERPPFDPYTKPENTQSSRPDQTQDADGGNVIPLPGQSPVEGSQGKGEGAVIEKIAPAGTALNDALRKILSADSSFEPGPFIQGATGAYEMIVTAFADGDRKTLKELLSKEVNEGFVTAIDEREKRGETIESSFVGIDKAEIVEAELKGSVAQVTVRIHSQLISATKDSEGHIIDGDPTKVSDVVDLWTFARDTNSRDPNWRLVATESAE
ncbi:Tim44/TimA family putative adaptor protein [Roseibium limicola]|uniref:Large ribosomal subunit protein mL45 n=1 Tax=Roseibium limicola TaxID=2816037 RepID=A0A939ET94_9HYPH|nr:Tim44/TimA family putative adaptor protein [Roseibium limicola]MBO0347223.1 Tim44 domain-containing protein [Roseibium limicola]